MRLLNKFHGQISIYGQRQNLKLNNFPSTKVIGLKFLPDLTHYEVCWFIKIGGCSSVTVNVINKRLPKKQDLEASDPAKIQNFFLFHHRVEHSRMRNRPIFIEINTAKHLKTDIFVSFHHRFCPGLSFSKILEKKTN